MADPDPDVGVGVAERLERLWRRVRPSWLPAADPYRREQIAALTRRSQQVLFFAALTGVATGAAVAVFEYVTLEIVFDGLRDSPLWLRAGAPLVGLLLAAAALRATGSGSPSTAEEYIENFHNQRGLMSLRPLPGRMLAAIATLGSGGALGYEGPSIYAGAGIGTFLQHRLRRFFGRDDAKVLLVAGAAAGVAAIFRAPATGVVFALEVPYRDDLARHQLLPASIAAAAGYLTFVALIGTAPLLPVEGTPDFAFAELAGAVAVGLGCGVLARAFSVLVRYSKELGSGRNPLWVAAAAGVPLVGLAVLSDALYDAPYTLGSGYETLQWALDPSRAVVAVLGLFALRALASLLTIGGRGAGGVFVPLVVLGALIGRAVGGLFGDTDSTLFPLIGIAAFLGAGYRVPLAAVMFVAESTGRPGFVVPGLVAAVTAQLMMGRWSVSHAQIGSRLGHLERRFSLPLASTIESDVLTAPPDSTVQEFFWNHLIGARQSTAPVVDGATYLGTVRIDELRAIPRADWEQVRVTEIMRTDVPVGRPGWLLRQAVEAMELSGVDRLPVTDDRGLFIGVVTMDAIVKLDDILEITGDS